MQKKHLFFISHSHWDREWYMSYEQHRYRLVEFFDTLLTVLEENPAFHSFHLDGQIILLEDYLEIRPEKQATIQQYVQSGRLVIGPWYVLQDEFLTCGEANIRNLLIGIQKSQKFGGASEIGYMPDTFGNISQLPQILNGFGITSAVVGRGLNTVCEAQPVEGSTSFPSELFWVAPDGSKLLCVNFANWYNNAGDVSGNPKEDIPYLLHAAENAARFATTPHLLMMNGSDHQPVLDNLPQILENLQPHFPEHTLVQGSLSEYFDRIKPFSPNMQTVCGELTGQKTSGLLALADTASSRIYQKQMNHYAQNLLIRWAEPFCTFANLHGAEYPTAFLAKAWEFLLQNHAHDSICGCSIDDVHEEMDVRYKKCTAIAKESFTRSIKHLAQQVDTSVFSHDSIPFVVFNPHLWELDTYVTATVDYTDGDAPSADSLCVLNCCGTQVPCDIQYTGRFFAYDLPEKGFRKAFYVNRYSVTFLAKQLPALGHSTFCLAPASRADLLKQAKDCPLTYGPQYAENEFLRFEIAHNGSITLLHKESGKIYENLNIFEDTADSGNEYTFVAKERTKTTENGKADISLAHSGATYVEFKIRCYLHCSAEFIPEEAVQTCIIDSFVRLYAEARRLDIRTTFTNKQHNHRMRVLFKTGLESDHHNVEGHFERLRRSNAPWEGWQNPSHCQRQNAYIDINDSQNGLLIANIGLPEYEIVPQNNTIALTILRAVGELGDWGIFPTPAAQCLGTCTSGYSIIPYAVNGIYSMLEACKEAYMANLGNLAYQQTMPHPGSLPLSHSYLGIKTDNLVLSACKKNEAGNSIILRVYNPYKNNGNLSFVNTDIASISECTLNEQTLISTVVKFDTFVCHSKKIKTFMVFHEK